jgi:DNA-nicking Smr family endonuclease
MNKYAREPEEVIDLHGKTTKEARGVLDALIKENNYNHVRIITGKGTFRDTGPVMKNFVEGYLKSLDIKFETAKLFNGGDGALEVYLKD